MTWYLQKFPRHPVAAGKFKIGGSNIIVSHYHYRVDTELGKFFLGFFGLHVHIQPVLLNLIQIGYQLLLHHLNQVIPVMKIVTIKKLQLYNYWIITEFLDNTTPKLSFTTFMY